MRLSQLENDVVIAWQRSQHLVEHAREQMAVKLDAVPSSVAATSLQQLVSPHSTASHRGVRALLDAQSFAHTPDYEHVRDGERSQQHHNHCLCSYCAILA